MDWVTGNEYLLNILMVSSEMPFARSSFTNSSFFCSSLWTAITNHTIGVNKMTGTYVFVFVSSRDTADVICTEQ